MAKQSNSRLKKQQTPADVMRVSVKLLVIAIRGLGSIGARGGAGGCAAGGHRSPPRGGVD